MSPPSIGVTKVVFTRRTISWVILSPSCSASRISRARPFSSGHCSSISFSSRAARRVFCPALLKRSKKTRSRGTSEEGHGRQATSLRRRRRSAPPRGRPTAAGGCAGSRRAALEQPGDLADPGRVEAEQGVRARPDRHRPLGVVAQGEAGDAEVGRLLLDPAGVGQHGAGVGLQREEVEVADRVDEVHARGVAAAPSIFRVRGWTGKTTGISRRDLGRARPSRRRAAGRRRAPAGAG